MLYPLLFEPNLHELVWGGHKLQTLKGLPTDGRCLGESWEISAVPSSQSVVANGSLAGKTLGDVVSTYGAALMGNRISKVNGDNFPLLVKFIDAQGDLTASRRGSSDVELPGSVAEIHTTQFDELTIVDVEVIHILLTCRCRHIGNNPRILYTHLRALQPVAPSHCLSLHALEGIQPAELFDRLLIEPVRHFFDGAVFMVDDL